MADGRYEDAVEEVRNRQALLFRGLLEAVRERAAALLRHPRPFEAVWTNTCSVAAPGIPLTGFEARVTGTFTPSATGDWQFGLTVVGPAVLWSQFRATENAGWREAVTGTVAALVGMIPEGLVLLTRKRAPRTRSGAAAVAL